MKNCRKNITVDMSWLGHFPKFNKKVLWNKMRWVKNFLKINIEGGFLLET